MITSSELRQLCGRHSHVKPLSAYTLRDRAHAWCLKQAGEITTTKAMRAFPGNRQAVIATILMRLRDKGVLKVVRVEEEGSKTGGRRYVCRVR